MALIRTTTPAKSPETPRPSEAPAASNPARITGAGSACMQRQDKERRLRELRDTHSCVNVIASHIENYYQNTRPPPWLDLGVVAEQLQRSTQLQSSHIAWKTLRASLVNIRVWMENYDSWRDAAASSIMPYLGTPSEIVALEFIYSRGAGLIPPCFRGLLAEVKLSFLLDWNRPDATQLPAFWKGAELENPQWRRQYMERRPTFLGLPFDDDLNDLVLSTMFRSDGLDGGGNQPSSSGTPPHEIADTGDNNDRESPNSAALVNRNEIEECIKTEKALHTVGCEDEPWENEVQASMSRITTYFNETITAETSRLLGKRRKQEDPMTQGASKRRSKPVEENKRPSKSLDEDSGPQKLISSIEDSDDDASSPSPTSLAINNRLAHVEAECRGLTAKCKTLKQLGRGQFNKYSRLEDTSKKLQEQIEQMSVQYRELLAVSERREAQYQRLEERFSALEGKNKQLEDEIKSLKQQTAVVAAHVEVLQRDEEEEEEEEEEDGPQSGVERGHPAAAAGEGKDGFPLPETQSPPRVPRRLASLPRIPEMPTFLAPLAPRQRHYRDLYHSEGAEAFDACGVLGRLAAAGKG